MSTILLVASITSFVQYSFADMVLLDKQNYVSGETIKISGIVSYVEGSFIGLQILNPTKTDLIMIDQFLPQKDGSFSKTYKAQGTKWNTDGVYTIKIVYDEQSFEKTFQFKKQVVTESKTTTSSTQDKTKLPTDSIQENKPLNESQPPITSVSEPKLRIQGFPDIKNSPNYYFERYENEKEYRDWFKKSFPDFAFTDVIGYKNTHVAGFPNNEKSPEYYVNRYYAEETYQDWFDSQFPESSIYDVLEYPEDLFQKVPSWIKNNAKWWSTGLISDSDFLKGITYLIEQRIVFIPDLPESNTEKIQKIPVWVKNTSEWWADGKINEKDFLKGIEFLVENGIILV